MKTLLRFLCAAVIGIGLLPSNGLSQTDGSATLRAQINDYNGSGTKHWTVVWIASESGTFIKTLWRQGPSIDKSHWSSHCRVWYDAKNGSTAFDGYSSATAQSYSGVNSPVILTWDCRDAANNLVPDGNYKFWVQYAEDSGQGPYTTSGLTWVKGTAGATNNYPDQSSNFSNMSVAWAPSTPPPVAPSITSAAPTATATVGVPYQFTSTATGTDPIGFTATGLPPGLSMSVAGLISGTPTTEGIFDGTITATNGVIPNATQPVGITVRVMPTTIAEVTMQGTSVTLTGTGPANGTYTLLSSTNSTLPAAQWNEETTGTIDGSGSFSVTNNPGNSLLPQFYRLRIP